MFLPIWQCAQRPAQAPDIDVSFILFAENLFILFSYNTVLGAITTRPESIRCSRSCIRAGFIDLRSNA
jgi:hypothetical protein